MHLAGAIALKNGEVERALNLFKASVTANPRHAVSHYDLGRTFQRLGRHQEAIASFDASIALKPKSAMAFFHRGRTLAALNHPLRAIESFDRAIEIRPELALAHLHRGVALGDLGRFAKAIASYERALELNPGLALAHNALASAQLQIRRPREALASTNRAIELDPTLAVAHSNRGAALIELGRAEEALASCDNAIGLLPNFALAHANRAAALRLLKRPDEAILAFDRAVTIQPRPPKLHSSRGAVLFELGRYEEALAALDLAIAQDPDLVEAHWNRALMNLTLGSFEEGWREFEWRKSLQQPLGDRSFSKPAWLGETDISGETILVHYEQGLGDTIQFCRLIPRLLETGARVKFAPQPSLRALLKPLAAMCEIVDLETGDLNFDCHCPLMSLPLALRIGSEGLPEQIPYLSAQSDRIAHWEDRLGPDGFKVGICWQGSLSKGDLARSFSVREFARLSDVPGLRLISLQKGEGESQLEDLPQGLRIESLGAEFDAGPDAFLDSAAAIALCDLVITSDTAIAHLAGAMGKLTWVALSHTADWRWMRNRDDSPWYPTVRLFRQKKFGDWPQVFNDIRRDLLAMLDGRQAPSPASR